MEIIYREESYAIMGACFEVYKEKGVAFLKVFIKSAWLLSLVCNKFRSLLNFHSRSVTKVNHFSNGMCLTLSALTRSS
jgi:hypothetical protein